MSDMTRGGDPVGVPGPDPPLFGSVGVPLHIDPHFFSCPSVFYLLTSFIFCAFQDINFCNRHHFFKCFARMLLTAGRMF